LKGIDIRGIGHEQAVRNVAIPASPTTFLVVILGGKRDSHVDDVSDIFFIDSHAETDSGNDAFGLARHETLEIALSLALWQFGMEKAA
jgi:hypothetical protein